MRAGVVSLRLSIRPPPAHHQRMVFVWLCMALYGFVWISFPDALLDHELLPQLQYRLLLLLFRTDLFNSEEGQRRAVHEIIRPTLTYSEDKESTEDGNE